MQLSSLIWGSSSSSSKKKRKTMNNSSYKDSNEEGLRLILANSDSNVVTKSRVSFPSNFTDDHHQLCCYLKFCHLCRKPLKLNQEIYMYRGDLGFCSVECRDKQVYMDEIREIEGSTFRRQGCRTAGNGAGLGKFRGRQFETGRVIFS